MITLKKKDILFYARTIPKVNIYEVCELTVRTVERDYFVGTDKRDKHAYLLSYTDINNTVFVNRNDALLKVQEMEKYKTNISEEIYYEEY